MKALPINGRALAVLAVVVPLLALLVYVALYSGPLAPVAVTVESVQSRPLSPALFGIGTVEARHRYPIGPTATGRLETLTVEVGDRVQAGQVLGEIDPVELDDRVSAQESALKRSQAALHEAQARLSFARSQALRYEQMWERHLISEEAVTAKRQELQIAQAAHAAASEDLARAGSDRNAVIAQRGNLKLIAPVAGIVVLRHVDPGTTVVAGQAVVELIDPTSLWVNVRFDQISAGGLAAGLDADIELRSRAGEPLPGRVLRVEPMADAVTEETLAKVVFANLPEPLPPIGELAEVSVRLPPVAAAPVLGNAAIRRDGERVGVWQLVDGSARFVEVRFGAADLDGQVQVLAGLKDGDQVIVYSEKAIGARSRIRVVEQIPGTAP
jgi:RND family efflux transporter MFP subunit